MTSSEVSTTCIKSRSLALMVLKRSNKVALIHSSNPLQKVDPTRITGNFSILAIDLNLFSTL